MHGGGDETVWAFEMHSGVWLMCILSSSFYNVIYLFGDILRQDEVLPY